MNSWWLKPLFLQRSGHSVEIPKATSWLLTKNNQLIQIKKKNLNKEDI